MDQKSQVVARILQNLPVAVLLRLLQNLPVEVGRIQVEVL
jgi:hypothetical protein